MARIFVMCWRQFEAEEGEFFYPTCMLGITCSRTRTKMADLGIIFLRRKHTIHWYQSRFTVITGSMPFRYFWATLYRKKLRGILPHFGKRKQVTKVKFLVKEQNASATSTDANGTPLCPTQHISQQDECPCTKSCPEEEHIRYNMKL